MRAPCGQWVEAALSAPGEEGAQVGFGVLAGGALEPGRAGSHCQPQRITWGTGRSEWTGPRSVKFIMSRRCGRFVSSPRSQNLHQARHVRAFTQALAMHKHTVPPLRARRC